MRAEKPIHGNAEWVRVRGVGEREEERERGERWSDINQQQECSLELSLRFHVCFCFSQGLAKSEERIFELLFVPKLCVCQVWKGEGKKEKLAITIFKFCTVRFWGAWTAQRQQQWTWFWLQFQCERCAGWETWRARRPQRLDTGCAVNLKPACLCFSLYSCDARDWEGAGKCWRRL